jgi:hypothetical protein
MRFTVEELAAANETREATSRLRAILKRQGRL